MKKLYIINTYRGVSEAMAAEYAISIYAEMKGGEVIFSEEQVEDKENAEIEYVDGLNLYYSNDIGAMRQQIIHRNNEFVKKALNNAKKLIMGKDEEGNDKTYLDVMLNQRIEGKNNAGSSYKVDSKEELYQKLISQEWSETTHPDVMPGCKVFKSNLAGLEGILDIDDLPDDVELYAIDPKETGKIGIGAGNIEKNPVKETYLIVGKEQIDGKEEDVVFTFHPGEPVRPSEIETKEIPDGTKLTKEEAEQLGFDKVKYLSDKLLEQYRHKYSAINLENSVKESKELDSEIAELEKGKEKE